jgi:hypothetical protein
MEATRRPKERASQNGRSRGPGTSPHGQEPGQTTSSKRVDESCPLRYYPLFALASRRRAPIRYY